MPGPKRFRLRARRPKPHSAWHLDEMFVSIGGRKMYAEGEVLDILVQAKRDKRAAARLMRKLKRKYTLDRLLRPPSLRIEYIRKQL